MSNNKVLNREYVYKQFSSYHTHVDDVLKTTSSKVNSKIEKVPGYGLSKNDFTDELKTKLEGLFTYDDTEVRSLIQENIDSLNVLKGDGEGSVLKTVNDEIEKILNESPDAFDTLKEISDWIDDHENRNGHMPLSIQKNKEAIAALSENMDNLEYEIEDENIDFTADMDFIRYEWIKVIEDSISFIGTGSLTDDPNDYTIDLVSCVESFDGTVLYSEPLTTVLSNITALSYDVNIAVDKNLNTANISVIGICANSTKYTSGKVDVVTFKLNEWSNVDSNSLQFSNINNPNDYTLTSSLNDYLIDAMISREIGIDNTVSTSPETVNLTTVKATGADVSVNLINSGNARTSEISISGYDLTSGTFTGEESTLNYVLRDWLFVDDSNIECVKVSNDKSDYLIDLVHCMQNPDGSYSYSDPVRVTLADAESLGLTVDLDFESGNNGRKAVITVQGIDIGSNEYTGNESSVSHKFEDWYSIDGEISRIDDDKDLTNSTSDYELSVVHNVGKDGSIESTSTTMTLAEAMNVGIEATVSLSSTTANGAIERKASINLVGSSLQTSEKFTSESKTVNFVLTDNEWYDTDYAVDLSFTGSGDLTDNKDDYLLTLAYVKQNDKGVYSTETVAMTLKDLDKAGLTTTLALSSPHANEVRQAHVTVSGAGISDNSQEYSETVSSRSFDLYSWYYVDDEIRFNGTGSLTTASDEYEVDVYKYVTKSSESSTGTLLNSSTKTLKELSDELGLAVSLTDTATDCAKQIDISISGYSITTNTSFSNSNSTISGSLHEWLKLDSTATFDTSNVTSDYNYNDCTVNNVNRYVETDTENTIRTVESNATYTIAKLKENNVTCNVSRVVNNNGTNYVVTSSLVASGRNLTSNNCTNAVQSVTIVSEKNLVYAATPTSAGSGLGYDSISKWEE